MLDVRIGVRGDKGRLWVFGLAVGFYLNFAGRGAHGGAFLDRPGTAAHIFGPHGQRPAGRNFLFCTFQKAPGFTGGIIPKNY